MNRVLPIHCRMGLFLSCVLSVCAVAHAEEASSPADFLRETIRIASLELPSWDERFAGAIDLALLGDDEGIESVRDILFGTNMFVSLMQEAQGREEVWPNPDFWYRICVSHATLMLARETLPPITEMLARWYYGSLKDARQMSRDQQFRKAIARFFWFLTSSPGWAGQAPVRADRIQVVVYEQASLDTVAVDGLGPNGLKCRAVFAKRTVGDSMVWLPVSLADHSPHGDAHPKSSSKRSEASPALRGADTNKACPPKEVLPTKLTP
ncbi:MAG: hypothetical protein HQ559_11580 [Lentisphaerae bacterium]|nr:hypothetical protein [Lentisphaerota bacterium]